MSGIPLQSGIIYGPILSRRLGRSLGVNLLPTNRKICSFDCLYCQYGPEKPFEVLEKYANFPTVDEVLEAVRYAFKKPRTIEYLTFSGNGEPTLHPDFEEIVQRVVLLRNELRPDTKLAILSNASQIVEPKILLAIQNYDTPMMKLDAGDEVTFNIINRPTENVHFSEIVSGLKKLPNLMIQSMLLDGDESNTRGDAFLAWKNLLVELQPKLIHIYTITRPTAYNGINAVSFSRLKEIAHDLNSSYGLNVIAFD